MLLTLAMTLLAAQANPPPDAVIAGETVRSNVLCRAGSGVSGSTEQHEGRIAGTGSCEYRITLRKGQSLRATLDADPGITAYVASPERHDLANGVRFVAPANGAYIVRVSQSRLFPRADDPAHSFKLKLTVD